MTRTGCPSGFSPLFSYPRVLFIRQSSLFHSSRRPPSRFFTRQNTAPKRQAFSVRYLQVSVEGSVSISPLNLQALGNNQRSLFTMHSPPRYLISLIFSFLMVVALPALPIFKQLVEHAKCGRTAIVDCSVAPDGEAQYSYSQLLEDVVKLRDELVDFVGKRDLEGGRVAFLLERGYNYVVALFSIWAVGGFAVPLCTTDPTHEMLYTIIDSDSELLLASQHFEPEIRELADAVANESTEKRALYIIPHNRPRIATSVPAIADCPINDPMRHALMIYTSGTTGKPKVSGLNELT